MALAAALTLGACDEARGGGYIGAPAPGSPFFEERADFGFNFICDAERVKGQITYHDPSGFLAFSEIRIHGTVEKVVIELVPDDPLTPEVDEQVVGPATKCVDVADAPVAMFMGTYRSQDPTITGRGKFTVQVRDQGEPSSPRDFNGDGFSIDLAGTPGEPLGPYGPYTRAGNIEGGNIQVE
jgi:hypothetical protein